MNRMIKAWGVVFLCLVIGTLSTGAVHAQDDECASFTEDIDYGDEVEGEITNDEIYVFYCFEGTEGDELVIDLEATDGDLDTYLILSDSTVDEVYAENDDIEDGNSNSHIEYTLEDDGIYLITVTRYDANEGETEGEYSLRLENESSSQSSSSSSGSGDVGQCPPGSNMLLPGYSISSVIDDETVARSYCFYATADTDYRVSVEASNGDLNPAVLVMTPDLETSIGQNDDANSRSEDARLDFVVETDGVYMIVVTRSGVKEGTTEGEYLVSFENRTTDEPEACPDALTFPRRGVSLERMEDVYLHQFCFNGEEGDEVTFTAEARRGDLDLLVFITEPDLDTIEEGESKDETMELTATLPEDGTYLLVVFDLTGLGLIDMTFESDSAGGSSSSHSPEPGTPEETLSGECSEEPLSFLVNGNWTSTTNQGTTQMDFACDGGVTVTVNGSSFDASYTFENDTLTLEMADGELVVEGVLLTRTALIGQADGQAFMMLNRAR